MNDECGEQELRGSGGHLSCVDSCIMCVCFAVKHTAADGAVCVSVDWRMLLDLVLSTSTV